jgi:hypothetical protein
MFYWLDGFIECLPPFFRQSVGLNPTSCTAFEGRLMGQPDTVSRPTCHAWARAVAHGRQL